MVEGGRKREREVNPKKKIEIQFIVYLLYHTEYIYTYIQKTTPVNTYARICSSHIISLLNRISALRHEYQVELLSVLSFRLLSSSPLT